MSNFPIVVEGFDEKEINEWDNKDLLDWLDESSINATQKEKLRKAFKTEEVTGDMIFDEGKFASVNDIKEFLGLPNIVIKKFLKELETWNNDETEDDNNDDEDENDEDIVKKLLERNNKAKSFRTDDGENFSVNVIGNQQKFILIENVSKSTTIKDVKQFFSDKTGTPTSKLGPFKYNGLKIKNDSETLEKLNINKFTRMPLMATFKVAGGSNTAHIDEEKEVKENNDSKILKKKKKKKKNGKKTKKIRKNIVRSLNKYVNHPKIKPLLTAAPDSLTFDDSKELRCKMNCGHIVGASSMYNVIKILFSEELSANKIICPMPKCGKIWDFELCCIIADLTDTELVKFNKIYLDRNSDPFSKCPTCSMSVSRPSDLTLFRVYHDKCPHYCWQCGNIWKNGPSTQICGNEKCPNNDVQKALKDCTWSDITHNNVTVKVPDFRLCPKCLTFINKDAGCKDVRCFSCGTHFCFGCLKLGNHACGGGWGGCKDGIAPSQKLI